jgi:hypothetical protein
MWVAAMLLAEIGGGAPTAFVPIVGADTLPGVVKLSDFDNAANAAFGSKTGGV